MCIRDRNSPYTTKELAGEWKHEFSRIEAAYPVEQEHKFWSSVSRIDNVYGDRNLVCSCSDYFTEEEKTVVGKK